MSADTDQEPQPGLISLDVTGAPRLDVSLGGIITCIVIGLLLGIVVIFALQFPIYLIESYLSEKSYLSEPYDRWLESIDQSWTESRWIYSIIVLPTCVFLVNAYDARSLRVRAREFKLPYYDVPYSEARRVVGAALHRRWFRHPRFWSAINACAAPLLIVALVSTEDEVLSGPYAAWDNWIVWGGIFLAVMLLINAARLFGYKSDLFRYGFSVFIRFLFWLIVPGLAMVAGFLAVHAPLFYFVYPKLEQWGAMTWIHEQFSHKADVFISCFILVAAARNQFVRPTIDRLFYGMAAALETWLAALRLPSAKSAERRDRRAPILYLRSFLDDQNALDAGSGDAVRLEEVVAHPLQDCGPLVAIGTPGEFTTPGAARAYFKDDEWQGAVISMMLRSAYIVIVSGWTKGLQWEVQTIKTQGHLGKSIWILPPLGKHHDVICDWLRAGFRATPYKRTARRADLRKALVVHPRSDGELVVITGRWASRGEYEAAIIAAMFGMVRHLADERKR